MNSIEKVSTELSRRFDRLSLKGNAFQRLPMATSEQVSKFIDKVLEIAPVCDLKKI